MSNNSNYNKVGYIEIPTDNVEETKEFYSKMFGWEYEKSKEEGGESEVVGGVLGEGYEGKFVAKGLVCP